MVVDLITPVAKQLVAWGNKSRAESRTEPTALQQRTVSLKLTPKYIFVLRKNGADATQLLAAMHGGYFVSYDARSMFGAPEFVVGPSEVALVGVFSCEQLGVVGWSETNFFGQKGYEHVRQFALAPALNDDAPYIRLAHKEQEFGEWILVAHNPMFLSGFHSYVFSVGHDSEGLWYLNGYDLSAGRRLYPGILVALRFAST